MAVTITPVANGMTGLAARTAINDNDAALATQVDANTDGITWLADGTTTIAEHQYNTGLSNPAHSEGLVFYDNVENTLAYYNDELDITVNIGQEMLMRVYNNSGGTIANGTPVRHNGVSLGIPAITPALADTFTNAVVLGVATHDIENNSYGYLTTFGVLHNLDTSLLTAGVPIYLSDTVPGGLTTSPPDIVTQIGGVLDSSVTGHLQVSIRNTINPPTIGAYFQNSATPISVTATPTEFNNFTTSRSLLVDITSGNSFKVPTDGTYTGSFTVSLSNITANANGHIIFIELYDKTTTTVLYTYNMIVGKSDTVASSSFSAPVELLANDDLSMRYWSTTAVGAAVVIDGISVSIESRQLRY